MDSLSSCLKVLSDKMRPERGRALVSVLLGLVRIAASLAFVWVSKVLVDAATSPGSDSLLKYALALAGIMTVQICANVAASWWERYFVVKVQNRMRRDSFGHLLCSVWTGREQHHSGDLVNRLEEDVRVVSDLVCVRIPDIVVTSAQLLAASVYMFCLAPSLLYLLLGLMVVAVVGSRMFFRTIRRLTASIRQKESEAQQHMQENLQNRVLALTLTGTARVLSRLGLIQKDLQKDTVRRLNYNALARAFMGFGFTFGYAAAFLWGVFGIRSGAVTFGMMTAFLQLVGQVQRPIADLARHVPAFIHALTSLERLSELDSLPLEQTGEPQWAGAAPQICVEGVSFAYEGQVNPVFDDFSCTFASGEITEVAGPTGIGKSTLIRLLLALLKPLAGRILIGGIEASASTRCNFMYVPQGGSLMSGTVRENLLLADPQASEEQMKQALETAAARFVLDLPDGLDTRCGESGSGLSEGQCQRIAIARALLRPGGILLLDEATSALDPATEAALLDNLRAACRGRRTVIFISHREAVASICDKVIRLG